MGGRGPAPKPPEQRRRRNTPTGGDWSASPAVCWQYGPIPVPPPGLSAPAREAWETWFAGWFAAHWIPGDLPGLRVLIKLFSLVASGRANGSERAELRQLMDNYGITPKGQQERRWAPPKTDPEPLPAGGTEPGPYGLRLVDTR